MDERQKTLLKHIIEEYAKSAEPVGSNLVAEKYMSNLSGPTVRNEMQELEREGFIEQPHTSAGRIPTERGWRYYLDNLLPERALGKSEQADLTRSFQSAREPEPAVKSLAKKTAELSGEAVVVGFAPNDTFYTGLANLFEKSEFANQESVVEFSQVIDHLDEVMGKMHRQLDDDITVLLGSDNPFGQECGAVLSAWKFNRTRAALGILGPMRMDYGANIAYIKFIKKLLEK